MPRLHAADADLDRVHRVEVVTADDLCVGLSLRRDLREVEQSAHSVDAARMLLAPQSRLSESIHTPGERDVPRGSEPPVASADRTSSPCPG